MTSRRTRARARCRCRSTRVDDVGRVALELLRAFAPPRPVRLLGVRVAGLSVEEAEPEQLALAV